MAILPWIVSVCPYLQPSSFSRGSGSYACQQINSPGAMASICLVIAVMTFAGILFINRISWLVLYFIAESEIGTTNASLLAISCLVRILLLGDRMSFKALKACFQPKFHDGGAFCGGEVVVLEQLLNESRAFMRET